MNLFSALRLFFLFCSFCLALTALAQRQASLVVRDGEVTREGDRRENDIKQAVVNQASHKQ